MKRVIVMMILVIVLAPVRVEARKSSSKDIPVRFEISNSNRYRCRVKVEGRGYLKDGGQKIKEGTVEYELRVGEEKKLEVIAEPGYEIGEIEYNGEEIERKNNEIIIKGVSGERELKVGFKKKEEIESNKGGAGMTDNTDRNKPDTRGDASQIKKEVETGDISRSKYVICLGLMIVMISMLKRKKMKEVYK